MGLFGSSGIRAVFSKELLSLAFRVGLAVGQKYRSVVVGRDTRTSSHALKCAVISGLLAGGARCHDAGLIPTPTLAYASRHFACGVMVTASHNPPEYNGLKLFNPDGSSFGARQQAELEEAVLKDGMTAPWQDVGDAGTYEVAMAEHLECILARLPAKPGVRVVVDAGGGAACGVTSQLLEKLGCEVITLNDAPTGFFPRGIEPLAENLTELCHLVRKTSASLGIAHDGDADRMMAVDEHGRFVSGDRLLAVLARAVGAREVVTTLDASMALETMGLKLRRTRVGDSFVAEELKKGGDFGGEASGAWIFPEVSLCPDGIYAAAQLVGVVAQNRLSELVAMVPVYPLHRGSIPIEGVNMSRLASELGKLKPLGIDTLDGLRLGFADGWLLVRPSGTEPRIRVTAEAKTEARAEELYRGALRAINASVVMHEREGQA